MGEYKEEVQIIEYDNKKIYGELFMPDGTGKFPAVILSHGYNGTHKSFEKYCGFFASNGIAAYCYDFCGGSINSKSSMKTTEMTIFTEKDDLKAVINQVKKWDKVDDNNVFIFGESQGGLVSALVADDCPAEIRGLLLLFPALCIADDWTKKYEDIEHIPEIIPFWNMNMGKEFMKSIYGFDVMQHIGKYDKSVLFMHGDKDPAVSYNYSLKAAKKYKNAHVEIFPGEGHGFSKEGNEKVMHLTVEFIEKNRS